jgi:hypothetical protein
MVKKAHCPALPRRYFTRPTPVPVKQALYREDAPVSVRGCSDRKGEAYSTVYVEPLSDMRTKLGKGRVLARLGGGGCSKTFFIILP